MKAALVIKKGAAKAQIIRLRAKSTLMGRMQGCDVRVPSKSVSRHHCKVRVKFDYLVVEDLDSANGTFVNGERIDGKRVLKPGDELQVGPIVFVVQYELSPTAKAQLNDETVMKSFEVEEVEEDDDIPAERATAVDIPIADDDEDDDPRPARSGDTTKSDVAIPTLADIKKHKDGKKMPPAAKKKEPSKKPEPKKPEPKKNEPDDSDMPDASSILGEDRNWAPPADNDLRNLLSEMEDE